MRYLQVAVIEDSSTLKFSDVASLASLEVYLSEAISLLIISSGSETGVTGGP